MGDAGGQLTERGELLRLDEAVLGGTQILQRPCQLARPLLLGVEQSRILDGDHSLVGEGCEQLDLFVSKRPWLRTG